MTVQHDSLPPIRIIKSMDKIYDITGHEMNIHTRMLDGKLQIIVNRACIECKDFRQFGGNTICSKCSYAKDWLEDGCY